MSDVSTISPKLLEDYELSPSSRASAAGDDKLPVTDFLQSLEAETSSAFLTAIVESSNDGIVGVSKDGIIKSWNRGAEQILGYSAAEMIGRSALVASKRMTPAELQGPESERLAAILKGEPVEPVETVRIRKDGSRVDVQISVSPVRSRNGQVLGIASTVRDISEKKGRERQMALLSAVVESSSDAIFTKTLEGIVTSCNKSAQQMFGYTPEEIIGRPMTMLFPPDRIAEEDGLLARMKAGETINHYETVRVRKDGTQFDALVTLSPIRDQAGQIIGISKTLRDISEIKRNEAEIRSGRAKLEAALKSMSDAVFITDADGNFVHFNHAFARINRFPSIEACLTSLKDYPALFEVFHPDGTPIAFDNWMIARALKGETGVDHEVVLRRKDTGERWMVSLNFAPIIDESGTITGAILTERDITEQKRAEAALVTQANLLKHSFDAIIVWRFDGAIESWNAGAEKLYGFSEEEAVGRVTHDLLSTIFPKPWPEIRADLIANGSWEGELRHRTRDGRELTLSARQQLVRDAAGIERVLETNRDITERKQYEARLQSMREELVHVGRLNELSQVSAGMAHELNQPLAAMLNYSNVARRLIASGDPQKLERASQSITRATEQALRAGAIIRRLRGFIEKRETNRSVESVNTIAEDSLALGLVGAAGNGITMRLDLAPDLPPVYADRLQLQQVIVNLVHNAVEAMAGAPRRELTITTGLAKKREVEISVADTGHGMTKEIADQIFMPFFTTRQGGMGIGLVISRSIIEAHGGQISVETSPGAGAVFRFTLPACHTDGSQTSAPDEL